MAPCRACDRRERYGVRVTPDAPAEIAPEARHHVETGGQMRMIVEFHREPPLGD